MIVSKSAGVVLRFRKEAREVGTQEGVCPNASRHGLTADKLVYVNQAGLDRAGYTLMPIHERFLYFSLFENTPGPAHRQSTIGSKPALWPIL